MSIFDTIFNTANTIGSFFDNINTAAGSVGSFFDQNPWLPDFANAISDVNSRESYADALREVGRNLEDFPNRANLNNSWEQISPILEGFTRPVTERFNEFHTNESEYLDRIGGSLDSWINRSGDLAGRMEELSAQLGDTSRLEALRPDFESYLPEQITSLSEIPGFDLSSQNLERAVQRSLASQGYGQSGNVLNAVAENLGQLGLTAYNNEVNSRNALFGARATADNARYQNDIATYQTGVESALAPLNTLAEMLSTNISSLSGLRGRTSENLQSGINSYADFNQGVSGNVMDYLARSQSDRAGLYGQVAESIGQMFADAAGVDATMWGGFWDQFGDRDPRSSNPSGAGAPPIKLPPGVPNTLDPNSLGIGPDGTILNTVIDNAMANPVGIAEFFANGAFPNPAWINALDVGADGLIQGTQVANAGGNIAGTGQLFANGGVDTGGALNLVGDTFINNAGGGVGSVGHLGPGADAASLPSGGVTNAAGSGISNAMSSFNEWFSGPGGTMAGFALPAGLFARASMQSGAERDSANQLADSITQRIESAPAGSTVRVNIGGQNFNLVAGSRHENRHGRWFRMTNGRWVGIQADGKNRPIVTDTPPDVSSQATAPSYVQNGRTVTGAATTPWQQGLPGAMPGETMEEYQARVSSSTYAPGGSTGGGGDR